MARKHLSHIKSKLTENGGPKLPTPSQLIEGEIAVNFAKGYETLSILNSNSGITTFSNDTTIMSYVDGQDMEIANAAGISAVTTSQGVTDYQYVTNPNNPILSGATSLKNADELLSQTILDNEIVIAAALNDLDDRKLDVSAYTPTDLSNYYNKQEIDTSLSGKQDTLIAGTGIQISGNVISSLATPYVETTYSALKDLRDGGELTPGTWYRITDYQCTTIQANTSAATHQFDILVLATGVDYLSEEARAAKHSGDTYFVNSNLNAWKVWYCLDNDTSRFAWADDSVDESIPASITINGVKYNRNPQEDELAGIHPYAWKADTAGKVFTNEEAPSGYPSNAYNNSTGGKGTKGYTIGSYTSGHEGTNLPNGRGVIYRMIDEWNNDCPYDFKNILFKRPLTNGRYDTGGTDTWCYTFNLTDLQDTSVNLDSSLVWRNYFDVSQTVDGVHDNKILPSTNTDGNESNVYELNGCVFLDIFDQDFFGSYGNIFLQDCRNNTLLDGSVQNIFEENCKNNIIFGCRNHFGQGCSGNEFTLNAIGSYFGRECVNNVGTGVYYCDFGNGCNSNHFSSILSGVTFGNFSSNNSIITQSRVTSFVIFENGVEYVDLISNIQVDSQHAGPLKNITIKSGVVGTSASHKVITHPTVNDTFHTTYQPANSQVISV